MISLIDHCLKSSTMTGRLFNAAPQGSRNIPSSIIRVPILAGNSEDTSGRAHKTLEARTFSCRTQYVTLKCLYLLYKRRLHDPQSLIASDVHLKIVTSSGQRSVLVAI